MDTVWEEQNTTNLPADEFKRLQPHYQLNGDKTCIMANESGVHIVGNKERKKHMKSSDDSRNSITVFRVGNAAGNNGPLVFLAVG